MIDSMAPVRRALAIVWQLQGRYAQGMRLTDLARGIEATLSTTLRTLETLADEGVVERVPGLPEHWHLTPKLVQLAYAHRDEVERLRQQADELNQRYTRSHQP